MQAPTAHWTLPFFDAAHRDLGARLAAWVPQQQVDETDDRSACKHWVRLLGDQGWLRYCVPAAFGGALEKLDSRRNEFNPRPRLQRRIAVKRHAIHIRVRGAPRKGVRRGCTGGCN